MLTEPKLWIDLAGVAMEIILLAYFMHTLFGVMRCSWYGGVVVYLLLGAILWGVSYGIEQAYLRTILYLLAIPLWLAWFYNSSLWTKLFAGFGFILLGAMLEYIVHSSLMLVAGDVYATGVNDLHDYILGLSLSKCLMLILTQLLAEGVKRSHQQKGQLSWQNFGLLLGFPIATIGAFFALYYAFINQNDLNGIVLLLTITVLFLSADIGIFVLFNRLLAAAELEQRHTIAQQQLDAQQRYYGALAEKNQSLRKWNHEVKNAFMVIAGYIRQGQAQEALDYMQRAGEHLGGTIENMTGNLALDAVFDHKKQIAQELGVALNPVVAIYETIDIDIMDLVVVLANGLDNALEATAKLPDPAGAVLTCELTLQQNWFKLVITNPVQQRVKLTEQALPTDKADALRHGIGLSNVECIVQAHHGQLALACTDDLFTFTAILANT